ncbi:DUF1905 domain-containing protein [Allobranchiibius huperziae]|uniref:DUF1905 domain-containing protein n=1 Tax=Allobranchiibius huperziae TaxID=1874116 RepID=A0A853DF77_9MICO|nr:DUF1905 domain-containing protein [Allobranchiibius huperziae]NYJ76152.1 hypothetical protein [Allobranchiibius huperziae]
MKSEFDAEIWYWKGPAPFYFVNLPEQDGADLRELAKEVSYGWGMIPVHARLGDTAWETSLFPREGRYALPLKAEVREAEGVGDGDSAHFEVTVAVRSGRWV